MQELSARAQVAWTDIWNARRLIEDAGRKLIVYTGKLEFSAWSVREIQELALSGYVGREQIGRRKVLILGSWQASERRMFEEQGGNPNAVLDRKIERYSPDQQKVLAMAFKEFEAARKSGSISLRQKIQFLSSCEQYPTNAVVDGLLRFFMRKDERPNDELNERYALGIIRSMYRDVYKKRVERARQGRIGARQEKIDRDIVFAAEDKSRKQRLVDEQVKKILAERGKTVLTVDVRELREVMVEAQGSVQ